MRPKPASTNPAKYIDPAVWHAVETPGSGPLAPLQAAVRVCSVAMNQSPDPTSTRPKMPTTPLRMIARVTAQLQQDNCCTMTHRCDAPSRWRLRFTGFAPGRTMLRGTSGSQESWLSGGSCNVRRRRDQMQAGHWPYCCGSARRALDSRPAVRLEVTTIRHQQPSAARRREPSPPESIRGHGRRRFHRECVRPRYRLPS